MLPGCTVVLFALLLIENVCANACGHDNCETSIDIPLVTKLNAPMKAELDISSLTTQLKELIGKEVKHAVTKAVNDLVENIMDKNVQTAVNRLQTSSNITISNFLQEMKAELEMKMEKNHELLMTKQNISATEINSLTILGNKLDGEMEQLKSEVKTATERVAITSCVADKTYNSGEIIQFSDVKMSNGIGDVDNFKSSGTFTCEKEGLYLVGAYILSHSNNAQFQILKNGILLSRVYVRPDLKSTDNNLHTGTGIIAVQLNTNDTIKIEAGPTMFVYYEYSCLTVIKVK